MVILDALTGATDKDSAHKKCNHAIPPTNMNVMRVYVSVECNNRECGR